MDILKLRDWYRTPVGHTVRRTLQPYFNKIWPDLAGKQVLVLGYGCPYIGLTQREAHVYCGMLGEMGVIHWPDEKPNRAFLTWGGELPLPDNFFDNILIVHGLEFSHYGEKMLHECQRVLKDDGRILVMAPNRNSPWSRREISPLAKGHPYSAHQLHKMMRATSFMPTHTEYALFTPPTKQKWILRAASTFEQTGQYIFTLLGGFLITEAKKDIYAGSVVKPESKKRYTIPSPVTSSTYSQSSK
jgi:SAM-dependent methyltransferase